MPRHPQETLLSIKQVEILRNSQVIASLPQAQGQKVFTGTFHDEDVVDGPDVLYYLLLPRCYLNKRIDRLVQSGLGATPYGVECVAG